MRIPTHALWVVIAIAIGCRIEAAPSKSVGILVRGDMHTGEEFQELQLRSAYKGVIIRPDGSTMDFSTINVGLIVFWDVDAAARFHQDPRQSPFRPAIAKVEFVVDRDPYQLCSDEHCRQVESSIAQLNGWMSEFKMAAPKLRSCRDALQGALDLYRVGKRRFNGAWMSPGQYAAATWLTEPLPGRITSPEHLRPVETRVEKIRALLAQYPEDGQALEPFLSAALLEINQFQDGGKKEHGSWSTADALRRSKFQEMLAGLDSVESAKLIAPRFQQIVSEYRLDASDELRLAERLLSALGGDPVPYGALIDTLTARSDVNRDFEGLVKGWKDELKQTREILRQADEAVVATQSKPGTREILCPADHKAIPPLPKDIFAGLDALRKEIARKALEIKHPPCQRDLRGCLAALESASDLVSIRSDCDAGLWCKAAEDLDRALKDRAWPDSRAADTVHCWYTAIAEVAKQRIAEADRHLKAANDATAEGKLSVAIKELRASYEWVKDPSVLQQLEKVGSRSLGL